MSALVGFFYRETRLLIMGVVLIVVGGLAGLWTLGRQEDPTLTNRYAQVTTLFPGAEPAVVEALVTAAIEDQIKLIADIDSFSSNSLPGVSSIGVVVSDNLPADRIEGVWADLRRAVDRARVDFPPGAGAPQVDTEGITAYTTVIALRMTDDTLSPAVAVRVAQRLEQMLRAIPLTRAVSVYGLQKEEVAVILDPGASGATGLTVDAVAAAIMAANDPALAGRVSGPDMEAGLVLSERLTSLDDLREVTIPLAAGGFGARLGDVAVVQRQLQTPADTLALSQGRPAVLVAAVVRDGAQVDRWMALVHEDVAALSRDLPRGLEVAVVFDQSVYTGQTLRDVGVNLLLGMALVLVVLSFTLGLRAAAVVGLMLPLVSLATLASFMYLGLPLHQMSLTGLIVALGLVVDNAIVTTDTVRRRLSLGDDREEAVRFTGARLFMPLAASTVTTVLTFLPMMLLPGNVGDFVRTIAIALSVMLVWSFVLAMALSGPLAALVLTPSDAMPRPDGRAVRVQRYLVDRPLRSLALSVALPTLGFVLFLGMPSQFFPPAERNQFHLSVELPGHVGIARSNDLARQVDAHLAGLEGITDRYWVVGGSAPAFYYNIVGLGASDPSYAQGMITTDTPARARDILATLQDDLRLRFPEARVTVRMLAQGPPVDAPVAWLIYGPDLAELRRIGAEVQQAVAALPETGQAIGGLTNGLPQLRFDVDADAARAMGLDAAVLAAGLRAGLSGAEADFLMEAGRRLPIRVQFPEALRTNPEALRDLPLQVAPAAPGQPAQIVPLSALAEPRLKVIEPLIYRYRGERMNYVLAYPRPDVLPHALMERAGAAIAAIEDSLPPGYRIELSGEAKERSATVDGLMASALLIAVLAVASLVVTFRSFRLTVGTLIVAALSAGLAILSVAVMGYPFGINALIGVIGSVGVSVNASIIIFTALQENPLAAAGDPAATTDEVLQGARHIISTTLTTVVGFLPLMLAGGTFWPPFAAAIAGGVLLSASLAFTFAPAWFRLVYPVHRFARIHALRAIPLVPQAPIHHAPARRMPFLRSSPFRAGHGLAASNAASRTKARLFTGAPRHPSKPHR